jgi:uncharacterized membrane protein YkvA (DUF1232 family)/GTP-binding protein EngB required for normal cell division
MKPNILICGQTGVGKSSIVNFIFKKNAAQIGENAEPCTKGIDFCPGGLINFYDSEGYEINKTNEYEKLLFVFLSERNDVNHGVHMVWYAISGSGKKITEFDIEIVKKIADAGFPVCVLLTKIDELDADQLDEMSSIISSELGGYPLFRLSIKNTGIQAYCEWNGLMDWSSDICKEVGRKFEFLDKYSSIHDEESFNRQKQSVGDGLSQKKKGVIAEIWDKVQALWKYVLSDQVSWHKKVLPLAALVYLVSPLDAVPDFIPGLGLLDDAAVISFVVWQMGSILKDFNDRQKG